MLSKNMAAVGCASLKFATIPFMDSFTPSTPFLNHSQLVYNSLNIVTVVAKAMALPATTDIASATPIMLPPACVTFIIISCNANPQCCNNGIAAPNTAAPGIAKANVCIESATTGLVFCKLANDVTRPFAKLIALTSTFPILCSRGSNVVIKLLFKLLKALPT